MSEKITQQLYEVNNPATGQRLGTIPNMTLQEVRAVIDRAYESLNELQSLSIAKRSSLLKRVSELVKTNQEDLAKTMTSEIGRPITSARGEIMRCGQIFELTGSEVKNVFTGRFVPLESYDFPAGNEKRIAIVKREPMGVVGTITPFNFPPSSFAHKVAPALAVGNAVVHKPTVLAPFTQMKIAKLIFEAGFPQDSVGVVTGDSSVIGKEFVENPNIALISFTGSDTVGLDLASRAILHGKRSIMELGGSDAQIVLEDADIPKAVGAAALGRFDYAGQFCNSTKRLIVRDEVASEFEDALIQRVKGMRVGDPMVETTSIGPLISKSAVNLMKEFVDDAKSSGGKILFQGEVPSDTQGYYFPPTIVEMQKQQKARMAHEEVFGPVFPIIRVKTDMEAISAANSTEFGLDASVFTKNFARAYSLASKLKVGTVLINDTTRLRWDNLPFGGVKRSGIGREDVTDTMQEMTESKVIEYNLG